MAALPPGVDPIVLADLKVAAEAYTFLLSIREPVEFWEIVRLAKTNRSLIQFQLKEPNRDRSTAQPILEELKPIRQQLSTTVQRLRRYLEKAPGRPDNAERMEMGLSFLLASAKDQQLIARWLEEPDKNLRKAGQKISAMASIADPYREVLLPWRLATAKPRPAVEAAAAVFSLDATEAAVLSPLDDEMDDPFEGGDFEPLAPEKSAEPEPPTPVFDAPPTPAASEPVIDVDPAVLEDLRLAFRCRTIFQETEQETDVWEVILLSTTERANTRQEVDRMLEAKEKGKPAKFHERARNLYTRVLTLRSKEAVWVRPLRVFLARLPVGGLTTDTLEMALGLLVVSSIGRKEAKKWLDEPGRHVDEAVSSLKDLLARARAYQASV